MINCVKLVTMHRVKITASVLLFLYTFMRLFTFFIKSKPPTLVSEVDSLPSDDYSDLSSSNNSIYFLETSATRRKLTSRALCSIESAARAHPDLQINVLVFAPISKRTLTLISFQLKLKNIRFARISLEKYCKNTPVEAHIMSSYLRNSEWRAELTSDLLRYLTLFKFGGIYLDTDVVVAKRLDNLAANWAASENNVSVSAGAINFSMDNTGRRIAFDVISEIQKTFRNDLWGYNGPGVITRILYEWCNTTDASLMNFDICQGFEVYGPELFYPISWANRDKYYEAGILEDQVAYVYHVWNHFTQGRAADKDSPYAQLARSFCPTTYNLYRDRFGL